MKRRAMKKILADALKVEKAYPYMSEDERADKLLKVLELHGIHPPGYENEQGNVIFEWEEEE